MKFSNPLLPIDRLSISLAQNFFLNQNRILNGNWAYNFRAHFLETTGSRLWIEHRLNILEIFLRALIFELHVSQPCFFAISPISQNSGPSLNGASKVDFYILRALLMTPLHKGRIQILRVGFELLTSLGPGVEQRQKPLPAVKSENQTIGLCQQP